MRDNTWRKELFYSKLAELHPTLKSCSEYVSGTSLMKFKCTVCRHEFENKPGQVIGQRKSGCPKCTVSSVTAKRQETMLKRQLEKIRTHLSGTTTQILYRIDSNNIQLKCTVCQSEWAGHRSMILKYKRGGCRKCSVGCVSTEMRKRTFQKKIQTRTDASFIPLTDDYKLLQGTCNTCGHKWKLKYKTAYNNCGCPECKIGKMLSSAKRRRKEITVQGKTFIVTGYEPRAIEHLIAKGTKAKDISAKVPSISYRYNKKTHKYFADLFIEKTNTLIEVKSPYTLGLHGEAFGKNVLKRNMAKAKAAKAAGFNHIVLLIGRNTTKIPLQVVQMPEQWHDFPTKVIRKKTLEHLQNVFGG